MMKRSWIPLLLLATAATARAQQLNVAELPTTKATTVLPAKTPGDEGLQIVGPAEADVDEYVHLEVVGLPPVDSSQTLDEALAWTKRIAMRVQQPPESEKVDFDVTLGFNLFPTLSWKLTLDLRAHVGGDYAIAFAMPGTAEDVPVQLATHGVRFGSGPVPPTPDPRMEVTPADPFSSKGPVGGPFAPASKAYLISNVGQGALSWTVNFTVPWLVASPPSGVLASGQATECFISFAEAAKSLPAGIHAGAVSFQNETNRKGDTPRLVALTVTSDPEPPPVEELWGAVIYETDDLDDYGPKTAQVLASERLRELDERFHWRLFDEDVEGPDGRVPDEAKPWIELAEEKNLELPHLFLVSQDGKLVHNGKLPASVDEVIELVRKHLPARR